MPLSPHYRIGRHPTLSKNPQLRWSVAQRQLFPLNLRFASVFCRVETIESGRYWGPGVFNEVITHNNACGTLLSLDILLIGVYWQCSGHGGWGSHCTGYQVLCRWHCSNCSMFCSVTNDSWAAVLGAAVLTRDIIICCSSWITSCCRHCYTADPGPTVTIVRLSQNESPHLQKLLGAWQITMILAAVWRPSAWAAAS